MLSASLQPAGLLGRIAAVRARTCGASSELPANGVCDERKVDAQISETTVEPTAEAARIKGGEAFNQERARAETLARELATLRVELDGARGRGYGDQEPAPGPRGETENIAPALASLRAGLDEARNATQRRQEPLRRKSNRGTRWNGTPNSYGRPRQPLQEIRPPSGPIRLEPQRQTLRRPSHASLPLIVRANPWPGPVRRSPRQRAAGPDLLLSKRPLRTRGGSPRRHCRRQRSRLPANSRGICGRKYLWWRKTLRRRSPLPAPSWTNKGCLLRQTCCSKLILATLAHGLNTHLSVAAREPHLCRHLRRPCAVIVASKRNPR
jgi:hypothetical protein